MTAISDSLKAALSDVQEAEIPEVLMPVAFEEALRLRRSDVKPSGNGGSGGSPGLAGTPSSGGGGLSQVAVRFGVEAAQIAEVFVDRDEEIRLGIGAKALASSKASATKEISLLIAGARQAAGVEEWTSVNVIRDECKHYGKYDGANFGKTITEMENFFQFTGKGQSREVKMRQPAWEAAGDLVRRVLGGD